MTAAAVGVARVSREKDGSASVADQTARITNEAGRLGHPLLEVFEEPDVSGGAPLARRHGLRQAVELIEAGEAKVLIVAYFDRLARSLKVQGEVLERVEAAGGRVLAVDVGEVSNGTAAQWLSAMQHGLMSEYFRRQVAERTANKKRESVEAGIPPFPRITPAYERGPDRKLVPHPVKAPIVAEAVRMRADGASFTTIHRYLKQNGVELARSGVQRLIGSRILRGEIHFGQYGSNLEAHDPVIDEATWQRANRMRATRGRYGKSDRLLARLGVLRCGTCGSRMVVTSTSRPTGRYPYYVCGNRLCERRALIPAAVAEETVRDAAIAATRDIVGREGLDEAVKEARVAAERADDTLTNAIRTLAGLEGERASRETLEELRHARDTAAAEHERLTGLVDPALTTRAADDWEEFTFAEQRRFIQLVVDRAVVEPGRGPGRVTVHPR